MKSKKLQNTGNTLTCLGGLLVIFNLTIWKESEWGLALAILAVVLVLAGLYAIKKAKEEKTES